MIVYVKLQEDMLWVQERKVQKGKCVRVMFGVVGEDEDEDDISRVGTSEQL